jgi:flagellar biosynthetic protein FliR
MGSEAIFLNEFTKLFLILIRMTAFMITIPVLSSIIVPSRYKAGMALILSVVVFPLVKLTVIPHSTIELFLFIINEVMAGLLISIVGIIVFEVFRTAGSYMGIETGLRMANVIDPYTASKFTLLDAFLYFFAVLIFFTINGHHLLILAIIQGFKIIPLGHMILSPEFGRHMIGNFTWMFYYAIMVALPITSTVLIIHVALGVIAKTAPKIQVFILSFPLKIGGGFFMLATIFPGIAFLVAKVYQKLYEQMIIAIRLLV